MPRTRLTSGQRERLHNELLAAFPSVPNMNALLAGIDRDFNQLSVPTYNLRDNVNEVIRTAEGEGWILDLVSQARAVRPHSPELQALDKELRPPAPASPPEPTTIRLTPDQHQTLHGALLAGFPRPVHMDDLLRLLDRDFNQLSVPTYNFRENVDAVIRTAEIEGWILDLVSQARTLIPNDPEFQALDEELQLRAQASPSELTTEGKAVTQQRIRPQVGSRPVRVFYSYSHQDEKFRERLEIHLAALRRQGLIDDWHDRKITAGNDWKNDIDNHLEAADVILLLVSSDFLASDYAYNREFKRALERHRTGEVRVVPIILRYSDWQETPIGQLQALPPDGRPVAGRGIAHGLRWQRASASS